MILERFKVPAKDQVRVSEAALRATVTQIFQKLGLTGSEKSSAVLKQMYSTEKDAAVKKTILNAFFIQNNATALVAIARAEQDPALKREAVQKLSLMNSKEATDYMMELLK